LAQAASLSFSTACRKEPRSFGFQATEFISNGTLGDAGPLNVVGKLATTASWQGLSDFTLSGSIG
jgi:hypothetical protein